MSEIVECCKIQFLQYRQCFEQTHKNIYTKYYQYYAELITIIFMIITSTIITTQKNNINIDD